MMALAVCACGVHIEVGKKPQVGKRVICPSCDEILEIVWLDPIELDWAIDGFKKVDEEDGQ